MVEKIIEVTNVYGLHQVPAYHVVTTAKKFISKITISKDNQTASADSILHIVMLAAPKGTSLKIRAIGADEVEALNAMIDIFSRLPVLLSDEEQLSKRLSFIKSRNSDIERHLNERRFFLKRNHFISKRNEDRPKVLVITHNFSDSENNHLKNYFSLDHKIFRQLSRLYDLKLCENLKMAADLAFNEEIDALITPIPLSKLIDNIGPVSPWTHFKNFYGTSLGYIRGIWETHPEIYIIAYTGIGRSSEEYLWDSGIDYVLFLSSNSQVRKQIFRHIAAAFTIKNMRCK